ncbi:MAG: glycosyl hydrolase family 28 protein [Acidobacteriota bacterium]
MRIEDVRNVKTAALSAAVLLFGAGLGAVAQDTRAVTEPKVPPVCVKLGAELWAAPDANGGRLREEDEGKLDTERIQKAMDGCGAGKAVELADHVGPLRGKAGNAYLTGPLELREGVTLLVDKGVTLFASRNPKVFEVAKAGDPQKCGTSEPRPTSFPTFALGGARPRGGCRPLISVMNVKNAAIMGEGTIDARGYAQILGKDYTWWQMARRAQPHDDLYYGIRMIVANHADGFILYGIHLNNSGNYHVSVGGTNGFTAWGVHLQTPVDKKLIGTENDARNTDGIDPGGSENITVAHSWIDNGDDNIAIKQGVSHMSVIDNHFYSGHGMSIGSETVLGQSFLLVDGLTEDHTTSGIRIKSNVKRGGPVHDLVYKNICMRDVPIPIAISPYYTNQTVEPFEDPKYEGDKIPDYKGIKLENIFATTPGDVLIAGLEGHVTEVKLDHVFLTGIKPSQVHLDYAKLVVGLTNIPLMPELEKNHVEVTHTVHNNALMADPCKGKFVPYQ